MVQMHYLRGFDKYMNAVWGVGGAIGCSIYLSFNTLWIKKIQENLQMYREGLPLKTPDDIMERCQRMVKIARIPSECKDEGEIPFFLINGDEPFSFGSVHTTYSSGIVGLPWNFTYKSVSDINKDEIRFLGDQTINWDSKAGKTLLESLVFSEKAQDFVILRQIYMLDNIKYILYGVIFMVVVGIGRNIAIYMNQKEGFQRLTFGGRFLGKSLAAAFCTAIFNACRDALHYYYQRKADRQAVSHGDSMYEGALEYYGKVLAANKSFRKMMGDEGKNYFSEDGDQYWSTWHFIFRPRPTPITERLAAINDLKTFHYDPDKEEKK